MAPIKQFQQQSILPVSLDAVVAFHSDVKALPRLTPPPMVVQLLHDGRTSLTQGEVDFRLWAGPVPIRWVARHESGPIPSSFVDRMVRGPMDLWVHEHLFRAVPGGVELTDRVTYRHPGGVRGLFTRLLFGAIPLRILFLYRHWRTRRALTAPRG